jgi:hypothetical protein
LQREDVHRRFRKIYNNKRLNFDITNEYELLINNNKVIRTHISKVTLISEP